MKKRPEWPNQKWYCLKRPKINDNYWIWLIFCNDHLESFVNTHASGAVDLVEHEHLASMYISLLLTESS